MVETLLFWKARSDIAMPAETIAREVNWGEEVEGLIDLPVRAIIDGLKAEFPECVEQPGSLSARTAGGGSWEATWGWQFFKVALSEGISVAETEDAKQRIIAVLADFGCGSYEV